MRNANFYCLRYFILPTANLFQSEKNEATKREIFEDALFKEQDWKTPRGALFTITGISRENDLIFGKLGKQATIKVPERTEHDIKEVSREEWPYVSFVCDTTRQLLAIESKSTVVYEPDEMGKVFTGFVSPALFLSGLTVHFDPIVTPNAFWDFVKSFERIYQLEFDLSAPNLFGANMKANQALAQLKKSFNITRAKVTLDNDRDGLDLESQRDEIDSYRDYADKGGGRWKLKGELAGGRIETRRSRDQAVQHQAKVDKTPDQDILVYVITLFKKDIQ